MPYSLLLLVYRKPGLTPEEFKIHYETVHIPLMQRIACEKFPLTHTRRYINRTVDTEKTAYPATVVSGTQADFPYDAVAELTFADEAACHASFAVMNSAENAPLVAEDCAKFMDTAKMTPMVLLDDCVETRRGGGNCMS